MTSAKHIVLVAGMGTSPAVLTNAVWALAHQREPVVPDEIAVFITKNGKTLLKKELFDDGVWADMLTCLAREGVNVEGKLLFGETSIRSIPDARGNEIGDLRTGEDNLRAADFMLAQLRQYTEDSGVELHVSIAAGRNPPLKPAFTSPNQNCYNTDNKQESFVSTGLCNGCCTGYWLAGAEIRGHVLW